MVCSFHSRPRRRPSTKATLAKRLFYIRLAWLSAAFSKFTWPRRIQLALRTRRWSIGKMYLARPRFIDHGVCTALAVSAVLPGINMSGLT